MKTAQTNKRGLYFLFEFSYLFLNVKVEYKTTLCYLISKNKLYTLQEFYLLGG